MRHLLPAVAEQLFKDIHKTHQETSQMSQKIVKLTFEEETSSVKNPQIIERFGHIDKGSIMDYLGLQFVFGSCSLQALDLVDQRSVTLVSSPSGRRAFQVAGGSGRLYTCFLSSHYCSCPAFAYTVLRRNDGLLCKHLLAVYLCQAMAVTQQESVSDQQMTALLSGTAAQ